MASVSTVRGQVDATDLGRTLMHEHVFNINAEIEKEFPDLAWTNDKGSVLADVVESLRAVKAAGIDTIVDCTAMGHGRDIKSLQYVNDRVDLNIVVCTGMYTYDYLPLYFEYRSATGTGGVDVLTEMFVRDLTEGIAATGVRAGAIKVATDHPGLTPNVERVLRAAARAHRATGAPITTHSVPALGNGLDQQRILAEEGVDLAKVVIGHSGDSTDLGYLRKLLDAGSTIGADRFGLYLPEAGLPAMDSRLETLAGLCREGYSGQIVLSHDVTCYADWLPRARGPELADWHMTHISETVVPALRDQGVTVEQIDAMLVDNPKRILEYERVS
jgi:phosphotriesterase-related protein